MDSVELLAPAGSLDAAYAAFHYGADAVYLGLRRFSARAGAENFGLDELSEIVAFAHAASPRRAVYVALNTLVRDPDLDEAIDFMAGAADLGIDALIVQDLGVVRIARRHFPELPLHASTQMAIHNLEGARAARKLGVSRVTLARELTLGEIRAIAAGSGLEVEVFIHGALCYAYSGLCLYSSLMRGRSGNRGECTYPCRDGFTAGSTGARSFPFSMKDLALPESIGALREAGVKSLKIEGRKKSALYVATTTDYYRKTIDGYLSPGERDAAVENIKTVFSRPWTRLYVASRQNRNVVDREVVGHRGAAIGAAERVVKRGRTAWLQFRTHRRLERHDGIQIDVAGADRPFGFAVGQLRVLHPGGRAEEVFEAPARAVVEIELPADAPAIASGARLYCASSQKVKQRYRFPRPKPGTFRVRYPLHVTVTLEPDRVAVTASLAGPAGTVSADAAVGGTFASSRNQTAVEQAAREAFAKLGDTVFRLESFELVNPGGLFVPVSLLNRVRREALERLAGSMDAARRARVSAVRESERGDPTGCPPDRLRWAVKTDRLEHVDAFEAEDWADLEELVVEIGPDPAGDLMKALEDCRSRVPGGAVRLALPAIAREWELPALRETVSCLAKTGWSRWEASGLWAWPLLEDCGGGESLRRPGGLVSDWPLYVTNRASAGLVMEWGVERFTLSPEDDVGELRGLLGRFGDRAIVIVYQDTPLFISETCAMPGLGRRCPWPAVCGDSQTDLTSDGDEQVTVLQKRCRTIVIGARPRDWGARLEELRAAGARHVRADFINRRYDPREALSLWRRLRAGIGGGA